MLLDDLKDQAELRSSVLSSVVRAIDPTFSASVQGLTLGVSAMMTSGVRIFGWCEKC